MYPFFYDPTYILVLPAFIFALYAQARVQAAFTRGMNIRSRAGVTGAQVASRLLADQGVDVSVEQIGRPMGDHFDPRSRVVRLSPQVYGGTSIAALAVAAHETGHAIQHSEGYAPLSVREAILPVASFGSTMALPLFILGMILGSPGISRFLMTLAIWLFAGAVAFQIVTLPVEYDASRRALAMLTGNGYITEAETPQARNVLNAAALTYVAAAAVALTQLLRLLVLRGSRRD
jgi:Zn-dependent membrane protease YugP